MSNESSEFEASDFRGDFRTALGTRLEEGARRICHYRQQLLDLIDGDADDDETETIAMSEGAENILTGIATWLLHGDRQGCPDFAWAVIEDLMSAIEGRKQ